MRVGWGQYIPEVGMVFRFLATYCYDARFQTEYRILFLDTRVSSDTEGSSQLDGATDRSIAKRGQIHF